MLAKKLCSSFERLQKRVYKRKNSSRLTSRKRLLRRKIGAWKHLNCHAAAETAFRSRF